MPSRVWSRRQRPQANLDLFAENAYMAQMFQNSAVIIYRWDGPM